MLPVQEFETVFLPVSSVSARLDMRRLFTARCYASAVLPMALCLSVSLSVCLSVTSRSSTKTAKLRITQTTPHDNPKISAKFDRGHPLRGSQMQVGWVKNRRLSTNNRLYLENGTR